MIVRSYSKIVWRIARRKGLRLLFKQWGGWKYRMIRGLLANRAALARAARRGGHRQWQGVAGAKRSDKSETG